jgi:hypothetical protein
MLTQKDIMNEYFMLFVKNLGGNKWGICKIFLGFEVMPRKINICHVTIIGFLLVSIF